MIESVAAVSCTTLTGASIRTASVPVFPSAVTEMVLVPVPALVTVNASAPEAFVAPLAGATVATEVVPELAASTRPWIGAPPLPVAVAVTASVPAPINESEGAVSTMLLIPGMTRRPSVPVFPSLTADIVASPGATAVMSPDDG